MLLSSVFSGLELLDPYQSFFLTIESFPIIIIVNHIFSSNQVPKPQRMPHKCQQTIEFRKVKELVQSICMALYDVSDTEGSTKKLTSILTEMWLHYEMQPDLSLSYEEHGKTAS